MKRILVCILAMIVVMSMSVTTAFGYSAVNMVVTPGLDTATIDGEEVSLDAAAKIINGRVMVPVRFVAESLGFDVVWNSEDRTISIGEDGRILLTVGSSSADMDGKEVALDSPPVIDNGFTLIPLSFVAESLGAEISWDPESRQAAVEYSDQLIDAKELYGQPVQGETEVLNALDDEFAYDFATKLASFGDAKDGRGMHLIGSKAGKKAAQFAYDTFKDIGLKPEFHTFDATGWEYYSSSLSIEGHDNLNYFITSAPHTPATTAEGITGQLVYVGQATKDELDGVDLTGKIAIADFDWDYSLWMNNIEHQVANHGAIGLIYYTTNPYGSDESGQAEFVADWSGKEATIPTWSMRQADGKELAAMAENEELTVTAYSDCKTIDNATGYNVMATLKGAKYPNEYIVINAHTDAYFHCLQDDSAPVGIMMAMAKAMVDTGYKPDRTIIFVTTDGEENGGGETFYDWLTGSWALVNEQVKAWGGKIVDAHTIEMIGDNQSTNFGYRVSDVMYLFTKAMAYGMNNSGAYDNEVLVDNYMTTSSDEWSFSYMGHPTTRTIMENKADEVYHSSMDNPERFSYENYVEHIKAQTTMILRIDKQPFAPYDLARDAELYLDSLDQDALSAEGLNAKEMVTVLEAYQDKAEHLLNTNLEISKRYQEAVARGENTAAADKLIADYNKALRASANTIIKGTQYVALDIPVNQIEYYQRIPAVFDQAIAVLASGESEGLLDALYGLDSDNLGQYSIWYTECLEYPTWHNTYFEALDPEASDIDVKWVTDILLKYYNVYAVMESVNAKAENGDTNFTEEITRLTEMRADAEKRLSNGFREDLQMWKKADGMLPLEQAEAILTALQ